MAWCLERKIPVGRRPFSQAGRRRSSFSGDEEQSPPPYPTQGPTRPRPRTHLHQMHKSGNVTPTWHQAFWGSMLFLAGSSGLTLTNGASPLTWMLLMLPVPLSSLFMSSHVNISSCRNYRFGSSWVLCPLCEAVITHVCFILHSLKCGDVTIHSAHDTITLILGSQYDFPTLLMKLSTKYSQNLFLMQKLPNSKYCKILAHHY